MNLSIHPHPQLEIAAFTIALPGGLAAHPTPVTVLDLLSLDADVPFTRPENVKTIIRDLLRQRGFKPAGRNKPASEYLLATVSKGSLGSINLVVDACNIASLHSGLPISVIDLDQASPPLHIRVADPDARYIFNATGQEISLSGLLCLHDALGPCANPVKDSQRTKTSPHTRQALAIVWGTQALPGLAAEVALWYRSLLTQGGASTHPVSTASTDDLDDPVADAEAWVGPEDDDLLAEDDLDLSLDELDDEAIIDTITDEDDNPELLASDDDLWDISDDPSTTEPDDIAGTAFDDDDLLDLLTDEVDLTSGDTVILPWRLRARLPALQLELDVLLDPTRAGSLLRIPDPPADPLHTTILVGPVEQQATLHTEAGAPLLRLGRDFLGARILVGSDGPSGVAL